MNHSIRKYSVLSVRIIYSLNTFKIPSLHIQTNPNYHIQEYLSVFYIQKIIRIFETDAVLHALVRVVEIAWILQGVPKNMRIQ